MLDRKTKQNFRLDFYKRFLKERGIIKIIIKGTLRHGGNRGAPTSQINETSNRRAKKEDAT